MYSINETKLGYEFFTDKGHHYCIALIPTFLFHSKVPETYKNEKEMYLAVDDEFSKSVEFDPKTGRTVGYFINTLLDQRPEFIVNVKFNNNDKKGKKRAVILEYWYREHINKNQIDLLFFEYQDISWATMLRNDSNYYPRLLEYISQLT